MPTCDVAGTTCPGCTVLENNIALFLKDPLANQHNQYNEGSRPMFCLYYSLAEGHVHSTVWMLHE